MLFALLASMCFGISDVFTKISSEKLREKKMLFYNAIFSLPVAFLFFLIFRGSFPLGKNLFILLLVQSISVIAYIFFFMALIDGPVSVVASVVAGYSVISVIGGTLFLGESLSIFELIGVILVISGSVTISYIPENDKIKGGRWIFWTFVATFLWGIWALLVKQFEKIVDPVSMPLIFSIVAPIIWLPLLKEDVFKIRINRTELKYIFFILISIILSTVGGFLFYKSVKVTFVSLAAPIVSSYPVFTITGSFLFLKERFLRHQYFSFAFIMIGILLCTGNF